MAWGPMETERITPSQRERDRIRVLHEVKQGHLTERKADWRLRPSDRQVRRRLSRIGKYGGRAVIHGWRGRPSNRRFPAPSHRLGFRNRYLRLHHGPKAAPRAVSPSGLRPPVLPQNNNQVFTKVLHRTIHGGQFYFALAAQGGDGCMPGMLPDSTGRKGETPSAR
jgi:hypothetical protein